MNAKIFVDLTTAAKILGISKTTLMISVEDGTIPVIQLGKRRYVPTRALEHIMQRPIDEVVSK
jgi:excisionase family DNA binding protein